MWIAVAVSPIFVIGLTLPFVKEQLSGFDELQTQFIQNLIAPITIGLSMTVGWIMLRGVQSLSRFDTGSSLNFGATSVGIPVEGLNTLQDLMVGVGVVAVVWVAVFAAANKTIASSATEMLKGGLQSAGTWLVKTPLKNLPGVPVQIPGEKGKTQVTLPQLGEAIKRMGETDYSKNRQFADKLMGANAIPPFRYLNSSEYKDHPDKTRRLFKTYERELKNGDEELHKQIKEYVASGAHSKLGTKEASIIQNLADVKTAAERKTFAEQLFRQDTETSKAKPFTTTEDTTAPAPVKDDSEVSIKPTQTYGGQAISSYGPSVVREIQMQTQAIVEKLKENGSKEELQNILSNYTAGGKKPTAAEVKKYMAGVKVGGNDAYGELIKKLPEAELRAELDDKTPPPTTTPPPTQTPTQTPT